MIHDETDVRTRPIDHALLAALACALIALLIPAHAAAANPPILVNSTANSVGAAACESALTTDECTLRGAIELANSRAGFDLIEFDNNIFKGQGGAGETIDVGSPPGPLPELESPAAVFGGSCAVVGELVPCATVEGEPDSPVIEVEAGETVVSSLAIVGGETAVEVHGDGEAQVFENVITASDIGIEVTGAGPGPGSFIEENFIEPGAKGIVVQNNSNAVFGNAIVSPDREGIAVAGDSNQILGNTIIEAGWSGIVVETDAEHNRIGGDQPGEENVIDRTEGEGEGEGPIVIFGRNSSRNEVAANLGSENHNAFIQLIGHGGTEVPNGGIKPPGVTAAYPASLSGTAEPNSTIRVFRKESAEAGELASLLAVVQADAAGNWTASYAPLPDGTLVAATQTTQAGTPEGATSEVSTAAAIVEAPHPGGGESGNGSPSSNSTPIPISSPGPKPAPPRAKITAGPKKTSTATTATFKFKAEPAAGARFECRLDGAKWAKCRSPKTYKKLKSRKHTFQVRAVAVAGTGPVAKFRFTVKP